MLHLCALIVIFINLIFDDDDEFFFRNEKIISNFIFFISI